MRRLTAAVLVLASLLVGAPAAQAAEPPPSVVLVLTDDQQADTLEEMPSVHRELVAHGVTFEHGLIGNSVCCPSRATFLTGLTSGHNGTWSNKGDYGGFGSFVDTNTVATQLQSFGYLTALFGKYLNGYQRANTYVPPGWSKWWAYQQCSPDSKVGYLDPCVFDGSTLEQKTGYGTDLMADEAVQMVEQADPETPLFMYVAPTVPHKPAIPAERHEGMYEGIAPHRPPSYNERRVGDKPAWVGRNPLLTAEDSAVLDQFRIDQLESIQAADDLVADLIAALESTDRMENTFFVFASDNGYLWGEHRLYGKNMPYDESLHVPFVVRYDPLTTGTTETRMVSNLDFTPTAVGLAGGDPTVGYDGLNLVKLLDGSAPGWRTDVLLEHLRPGSLKEAPSFCGVRTARRKFVHYETGEEEFYTLASDPYEMVNKAARPRWETAVAQLRDRARVLCQPLPPGMAAF
jgi:N-acetylglucosamine-6-sulfatase